MKCFKKFYKKIKILYNYLYLLNECFKIFRIIKLKIKKNYYKFIYKT